VIVALTGGTGGAKLIDGLAAEMNSAELTSICNTADDFILHGLSISPDLDTITYTLAGLADAERGWGIKGDTFEALAQLGKYGFETWFKLGDRDLALHIARTKLLSEGLTLSQVAQHISGRLGLKAKILPMSDDRIETRLLTAHGELSFQEFFVKERWSPEVTGVRIIGAEQSRPAAGVLDAIHEAELIVICPSNPITSIGPILSVPGIRAGLTETQARVVGVSPIIQGAAVSGPAEKLMAAAGRESSALGVATGYVDFLDVFLIATDDEKLRSGIERLGIEVVATNIRMTSLADKCRLAREVLALLRK
jgi:LPPG:FO 2-phospho-L-lactate transferase